MDTPLQSSISIPNIANRNKGGRPPFSYSPITLSGTATAFDPDVLGEETTEVDWTLSIDPLLLHRRPSGGRGAGDRESAVPAIDYGSNSATASEVTSS